LSTEGEATFQSSQTFITNTYAVVSPPPAGQVAYDLYSAIATANTSGANPYIIYLLEGVFPIDQTQVLQANMYFYGRGVDTTVIQRQAGVPPSAMASLMTLNGNVVRLENLTVSDGMATSGAGTAGAVFIWSGILVVEDSKFQNNEAFSGGTIYNQGGQIELRRTIFYNSRAIGAFGDGGAIYTINSIPVATCVRFESNQAVRAGGALASNTGQVTIDHSTFIGNTAATSRHVHNYAVSPQISALSNWWNSDGVIQPNDVSAVNTGIPLSGDPTAPYTNVIPPNNNPTALYNGSLYTVWPSCVMQAPEPVPQVPTATPTFTVTPTASPTSIPRDVAWYAQPFHNGARLYGLPLPFTRLPYNITEADQGTISQIWMQGYGPITWAFQNQTLYDGTHGIHTGLDYGADSGWSRRWVVAICDGVIVGGRPGSGGGSTQSDQGLGVSVRCFADEPRDPEGNGIPNLSNIILTYNHLTIVCTQVDSSNNCIDNLEIGEVVTVGQRLGKTGETDVDHLHLEAFLATGFCNNSAIRLNPLLLYTRVVAEQHTQPPLGPYFPILSYNDRSRSFDPNPYGIAVGDLERWSQSGDVVGPQGIFWDIQNSATPGPEWTSRMIADGSLLDYLSNNGYPTTGPNYITPDHTSVSLTC
jgi:hypothetical protein